MEIIPSKLTPCGESSPYAEGHKQQQSDVKKKREESVLAPIFSKSV